MHILTLTDDSVTNNIFFTLILSKHSDLLCVRKFLLPQFRPHASVDCQWLLIVMIITLKYQYIYMINVDVLLIILCRTQQKSKL